MAERMLLLPVLICASRTHNNQTINEDPTFSLVLKIGEKDHPACLLFVIRVAIEGVLASLFFKNGNIKRYRPETHIERYHWGYRNICCLSFKPSN